MTNNDAHLPRRQKSLKLSAAHASGAPSQLRRVAKMRQTRRRCYPLRYSSALVRREVRRPQMLAQSNTASPSRQEADTTFAGGEANTRYCRQKHICCDLWLRYASIGSALAHPPHSPTHVQAAHPATRFGRAGEQQGVAGASHARGIRQVDARPQRRFRDKSTPRWAHQSQQQAGVGGKAGEYVERQKTRKRREADTRNSLHTAVGLHDRREEEKQGQKRGVRAALSYNARSPSPYTAAWTHFFQALVVGQR